MPLITLEHLKMILNAINNKIQELPEERLLAWLDEEDIVSPTVSNLGEIYVNNNNEIYIL